MQISAFGFENALSEIEEVLGDLQRTAIHIDMDLPTDTDPHIRKPTLTQSGTIAGVTSVLSVNYAESYFELRERDYAQKVGIKLRVTHNKSLNKYA